MKLRQRVGCTSPACGGGRREATGGGSLHIGAPDAEAAPTPTLPRKRGGGGKASGQKPKTPRVAAGFQAGGAGLSGPATEGRLRRDALVGLVRLAQHVAAAPHGLDEVAAFGGIRKLLAELADEDVDDLQLRLVHAAIE